MVKGITRQVIVVQSPDPKLFEEAIFILKNDAVGEGITDEILLKEAKQAIRESQGKEKSWGYGPLWACGGAFVTALLWLVTMVL